jgi:hypothetical protein
MLCDNSGRNSYEARATVDTVLLGISKFDMWSIVHINVTNFEKEKSDTLRNETYVEPDPYDYIV